MTVEEVEQVVKEMLPHKVEPTIAEPTSSSPENDWSYKRENRT